MSLSRSKEDVFELLDLATPGITGFYEKAQLLTMTDHSNPDDLFLLEITPALSDQLLSPSGNLVSHFKSQRSQNHDTPAYFCFESKTFKLLETETSNSLLLLPNLWLPPEKGGEKKCTKSKVVTTALVSAIKNSYLETVLTRAPRLNTLKKLLLPSSFTGHIEEEDQPADATKDFFTFIDLIESIPCTEKELLWALDKLHVMLWKGYCRLFEVEYLNSVLQAIFNLADEYSWNWPVDGIPADTTINLLSDLYPSTVIRQVFQHFFSKHQTARRQQIDLHVFPRVAPICRLIGEHLLSVTTKFALQDFYSVWCAAVPRGMKPLLRQHLICTGRAICESCIEYSKPTDLAVDRSLRGQSISLLCSEDLPDESVEARILSLFEKKPDWAEAELAGYISDLVVDMDIDFDSCVPYDENVSLDSLVLPHSGDEEEKIDFNLFDLTATEANVPLIFDNPKPIPAVIVTILTQHCRAVSTGSNRIYTEKYPKK